MSYCQSPQRHPKQSRSEGDLGALPDRTSARENATQGKIDQKQPWMRSSANHLDPPTLSPRSSAIDACFPITSSLPCSQPSRRAHSLHHYSNDILTSSTAHGIHEAKVRKRSACPEEACIATSLPTEVLHEIYDNLGPRDFNAARHSCISWMAASLSVDVLSTQLKRGGWRFKASSRATGFREWRPWPMSCYLSRECALAGDWTGQGLSHSGSSECKPMRETCTADLRLFEQALAAQTTRVCTTSTCGRYLILASGREMHTYEIEGRSLRLLSKTSCERQVLAVTLDATPKRFVIAALLEGRIGLYIDMYGSSEPAVPISQWDTAGTLNNASSSSAPIMDFGNADGARSREVVAGDLDELSLNAASIGETTFLHQSVEIVTQRSWAEYFHAGRARLRGTRHLPSSGNGVWPEALNFSEKAKGKKPEVEVPPQTVYRNVCFDDDGPVSVAISPTRQCLAFGCRAGVELYWIDPTTGQNLNRYFPLTKPSNHLHFLPPRRNIDSAFRLRLISSPDYTPPEEEEYEKQPMQSPQTSFWFTLSGPWRFPLARAARQQAHNTDHSYAVPLSDGHHILFTDNATGLLCLGGDRPAGNLQRLSRKFIFEPPADSDCYEKQSAPKLYAATRSLYNGARIVAAFGDIIVLYSIPIDPLKYSTAEQEGTAQDSSKPFEELEWLNILPHPTSNAQAVQESERAGAARFQKLNMLWAHYMTSSGNEAQSSLDELWPLRIQDTVIGSLDSVQALSVQESTTHGLVLWAFGTSGFSKAWEVDDGQWPFEQTCVKVMSDRLVRDLQMPANENGEYLS